MAPPLLHLRAARKRALLLPICVFSTALALAAPIHAASPSAKAAAFRAGAAASNITPPLGASLDGTITHNGPARHVHDELHARCLVLDDGNTRLAIAVVDATMISRDILDRAKDIIASQSNIPHDRVLISATHTHSSPRPVTGLNEAPVDIAYLDFLAKRIADGVERAANNLAPASAGWGRAALPDYVHNRRWFLVPGKVPANPFGETGEQVQMNPPAGSPGLVKPAGPVDPEVFVFSIRHADGRPLALLANYGTHYVGNTTGGHISADYFGAFAGDIAYLLEAERQDPPFVGILSNGTSGDVQTNDLTQAREKLPPFVRIKTIANHLARVVHDITKAIEHRGDLTLDMAQTELELGIRKPDDARIAWAEKTYAGEKSGPGHRFTRPQVYARETLHLSRHPDKKSILLQAIRIGDLAIASSPCETFAETGLAIKRDSPFEHTFTIELANGAAGYLPTPQQHEWGGYETWPARSSLLEVQAEPKIRQAVQSLLATLKK